MRYYKIFLSIFVHGVLCIISVVLYAQVERSWVKTYNASGDYRDCSYGVAVDKAGYVYVTGQGYGERTQCDYTTIKYAPNGDIIWIKTYNGPEDGYDKPYAIAVDDLGYIYVTGRIWGGEATFEDIATIKYAPNGNEVWVKIYDGPARDYDCGYAIAVDKQYNVYVTGESYGGDDTWEDIVTIKYDKDGKEVWVERYDGPDNDMDYPTSLAVDENFNVYVTGLSYSLDTDEDFVTLKYAQPGELRKFQEAQRAALEAELAKEKEKKRGFFSWFRRGE